MIPTARNVLTRPPTGAPRRANCPGEGLLVFPTSPSGEQPDCPSLRASREHIPIVRPRRARRMVWLLPSPFFSILLVGLGLTGGRIMQSVDADERVGVLHLLFDEDLFKDTVTRERKRTERSGLAMVMLLVGVQNGRRLDTPLVFEGVAKALSAVKSEID